MLPKATADSDTADEATASSVTASESEAPSSDLQVSARGPNLIYLGLATFAAGFLAILWQLYVFYSGGAAGGLSNFFRTIQFWDFVLYLLSAIGVLLVGVGFIVELRDVAHARDPTPLPEVHRQRRWGLAAFAAGIGLIVTSYLAYSALELYSYERAGFSMPTWTSTSIGVAVAAGIIVAASGWFVQHQVRPSTRRPPQ